MSRLLDTVNILGTDYDIYEQPESENPKLRDNQAISEYYTHSMIIDMSNSSEEDVDNIDAYYHKVLRHEAFHCILFEAGLSEYDRDENLVEALARLYPKIKVVMDRLDSINLKG